MTSPASDTLERERDKLWLTDAELIRRLGVPECPWSFVGHALVIGSATSRVERRRDAVHTLSCKASRKVDRF